LTTSNSPDDTKINSLPGLPSNDEGPVFAEPWQAQAFAMAVKLSEQGLFTWKEWATTLAEELQSAANQGNPDDGTHYYNHWVSALERLVTDKSQIESITLRERKEAWADAYRHTPHGSPVSLRQSEET
jgi:nitrile hydratase accessory protein